MKEKESKGYLSEQEAEELEVLVPEVLPEQKFHVMVKEANLDESRAGYLLKEFSGHFKEAAEWAKKSKDIWVTNENQTVMMEMARTGRLFLSNKRQDIEKARKWMKEPALREGQAIDKIANLLKDTIIPTEEHLRRQEDFVKLRQEAEEKRIRLEIEKKLAEEELEKQRKLSEEHTKLQAENTRLQLEARKKQQELESERKRVAYEQEKLKKENEEKIAEENRKRQAELELVRKENEKKLAIERAEREKSEAELREKKQAEQKAEADRIRAEERAKSAGDEEKLMVYRNKIGILLSQAPEVKGQKNIKIIEDIKSHLNLAFMMIKINEEEE